jgi:ribosome maturation factor RimP
MRQSIEDLRPMIEATLSARFPEVELVDLEVRGGTGDTLTLFIDRQGGVDLELCAAVSRALDDVRATYRLEVSSPGLNRRLRTPAHFADAVGREVVVKTAEALGGRRNFRGVLVTADTASVTVETAEGDRYTLPIAAIAKAHVVYDYATDGGQRE